MKKAFVLGLVGTMFLLGCELIVDFDRTKIVGEEIPETGTSDAVVTTDTGATDTGTADTGTDTGADTDAGTDAADAATDG